MSEKVKSNGKHWNFYMSSMTFMFERCAYYSSKWLIYFYVVAAFVNGGFGESGLGLGKVEAAAMQSNLVAFTYHVHTSTYVNFSLVISNIRYLKCLARFTCALIIFPSFHTCLLAFLTTKVSPATTQSVITQLPPLFPVVQTCLSFCACRVAATISGLWLGYVTLP